MKIHLIAIGKARGSYAEMAEEYAKRLTTPFVLRELTAPTQKAEGEALLNAVPKEATVVLMDERGKDLSSRELSAQMTKWQDSGVRDLVFIIGGADGLTDEVRARGQFTLGLGHKTWPHMLARVMLLEQIYRAQQIAAGHPYHRD